MMFTKKCTNCGEEKSVVEFSINRSATDGRQSWCKKCSSRAVVEWQRANTDKVSAIRRKFNYGISHEDYTNKLVSQEYRCDCCKEPLHLENRQSVHLDHNHETGQVRGILCRSCNYMVGHAKDSPDRLSAGVAYLKAYQGASNDGNT